MKIPNTPFSTRLSGSAKETELRLRSICQWKKKRPPVVVALLAVFAVVFCGGLVAFVPSHELIPDDVDTLAIMELSDSLVYIDGWSDHDFDLYWVKEGQEPDLLCSFGHWGNPNVQFKKMQLGEHEYLLVQHDGHYNDVPFWVFKEFTNIFYLPKEGAPVYTLQIEGDFHLKDITGDGIEEIVHLKKFRDDINDRYYMAVSDGRLLRTNEYGSLMGEDISEVTLERLYSENLTTGTDYAAALVRKYEGIDLRIFEDSLSVWGEEDKAWKEMADS